MPTSPRIEFEGIVFRNPIPGHVAMAAIYPSLVALSASDILCAYQRGQASYSLDRKFWLARSTDSGRTWRDQCLISPQPRGDEERYTYNGPWLTRMRDGELVLLGHRQEAIEANLIEYNPETGGWLGSEMFIQRSRDDGRTWLPQEKLSLPGMPQVCSPGPIVELANDRWFMVLEVWKAWDDPAPLRLTSFGLISEDRGRTWPRRVEFPWNTHPTRMYSHCQYRPLRSGGVIGSIWAQAIGGQEDFDLHIVRSDATGANWSGPHPTSIMGQSSSITDLGNGRLALLYSYRGTDAPSIRLVLSHDDARTWDTAHEIIVWDAVGSEYLGSTHKPSYPASHDNIAFGKPESILLPDGTVLCAWWCTHKCVTQVRCARVAI